MSYYRRRRRYAEAASYEFTSLDLRDMVYEFEKHGDIRPIGGAVVMLRKHGLDTPENIQNVFEGFVEVMQEYLPIGELSEYDLEYAKYSAREAAKFHAEDIIDEYFYQHQHEYPRYE